MHWPSIDNDTVDWESVFDDADTGLAVFAKRARTKQALVRCAHMIVQNLFIRDNDPPYRDAFNLAIDELAATGDENTREKILDLIEDIKINRIERAGYYLESEKGDDERRLAQDSPMDALKGLSQG